MPRINFRRSLRRSVRDDRGAALVEFAIVLPMLLLVVWGIVDFGRLFFTSNSLATSVREGARYAAVLSSPSAGTAAIKSKVQASFTPFGGPALTAGLITVLDNSLVDGTVTVRITNYPAPIITPMSALFGTTRTMTRQATFRWEQAAP